MNQLATTSMPLMDVDVDRPNRLLVAQSNAYSLARNEEPIEEIKAAIDADLARAIDLALLGVRRELAETATRDQGAYVIAELGKYLRFGAGGVTDREEWLAGVLDELREYPFLLVVESIPRARKKVTAPWGMVAWVVADIEEAVAKLRVEEKLVADLREIARS